MPGKPDSGNAAAGAWKQTLQAGRARLRENYRQRPSAPRLLQQHATLVDDLLCEIWQSHAMPPDLALIAVGGYGRGELYPYSDIDVLILLPHEAGAVLEEKLSQLIGLLWDSGLELGHSVRTVEQCAEEALHDITVQTSLLEARLLCGANSLFRAFVNRMSEALDPRTFYTAKLLEQQQRHIRAQDTAYNLEPNIKENPGGLRDLQNVLWISRAADIGLSWSDLAANSLISQSEAQTIRSHELLLQNLRIRLHYLAARREDRLLFDFQTALAQQFNFSERPARRASEQLMQRYYRTAKTISLFNAILLQGLRARLIPASDGKTYPINERFQIRHELLEARSERVFEQTPSAILENFLLLQQHPQLKGIHTTTLRALWRAKRLIDQKFRRDPANRALFMQILRQQSGITHELRQMNQYGILARYIPAFGRIVGQMQHDLFHAYTVDEHTLRVLRNVRRFTVAEFAHEFPLCSRLISGFERAEVLYLAALFHDIAKGRGGDHSQLGKRDARRFCRAHDLPPADTALVEWLVEHHLTMSATAQKQDVTDPQVVAAFAVKVADERRLTALYLLTVADIRGTSPKVWNAWKGKLLEDLFWAARRYLCGDASSPESSMRMRQDEALRRLRLYGLQDGVERELWNQLDTTYFLRHDDQEIAWHTRQIYYCVNTPTAVVKARLSQIGEGLQVMIYTPNQKDLFARICSFFERMNYSIVEAKVHTTRHGYALDSFQVMDPGDKTAHYRNLLNFVEHELGLRLSHQAPLEPPTQGRVSRHLKHFPITPEINIQPDDKGFYHVLSLIAGDRPGLLSRVARVLVEYGVNLHTAKINTLGERAEDTFLVTGAALDNPKTVLRLENQLLEQLQT